MHAGQMHKTGQSSGNANNTELIVAGVVLGGGGVQVFAHRDKHESIKQSEL